MCAEGIGGLPPGNSFACGQPHLSELERKRRGPQRSWWRKMHVPCDDYLDGSPAKALRETLERTKPAEEGEEEEEEEAQGACGEVGSKEDIGEDGPVKDSSHKKRDSYRN